DVLVTETAGKLPRGDLRLELVPVARAGQAARETPVADVPSAHPEVEVRGRRTFSHCCCHVVPPVVANRSDAIAEIGRIRPSICALLTFVLTPSARPPACSLP